MGLGKFAMSVLVFSAMTWALGLSATFRNHGIVGVTTKLLFGENGFKKVENTFSNGLVASRSPILVLKAEPLPPKTGPSGWPNASLISSRSKHQGWVDDPE
jgi:hypothetical protein